MRLLTKEAVVFFRPVKRKLKSCCRPLMVNNDNMAASVEQNRQEDDKDHQLIPQVIAVTSSASLQTASKTEGANRQNPRPTLGERTDHHERLPGETNQHLFNETLCTRWTYSSSESKRNTSFDIYQAKQMQHKITNAQVKVNLSDDETRLVNGLLTTTLCSTEL